MALSHVQPLPNTSFQVQYWQDFFYRTPGSNCRTVGKAKVQPTGSEPKQYLVENNEATR